MNAIILSAALFLLGQNTGPNDGPGCHKYSMIAIHHWWGAGPGSQISFIICWTGSVERLWKKEEERGWNKERRNDAEWKERNICEEVVHVRRRGWTIEDRDGYLHLRKTALILWSAGCRDKDERGNDTGTAEKGERHKERLVFNSFGKETEDRKWRRKKKGAWLRQKCRKIRTKCLISKNRKKQAE